VIIRDGTAIQNRRDDSRNTECDSINSRVLGWKCPDLGHGRSMIGLLLPDLAIRAKVGESSEWLGCFFRAG